MERERRSRAFDAFERVTELPMLVLSVVFIGVIVVPLVTTVSGASQTLLSTIDWTIWAAFAVELVVKTSLSARRWHYLETHWFDVVIVVIPFLRPLRIARSVRVLREFELLRLGSVGAEIATAARDILRRHGLQYVLLLSGLLIVGAAAAETLFERAAGGTITNFGTGLWWAISTITTVGYGDTYPKTPEGRGVAVFLMIVGVALFSFLTANISAFLIDTQHSKQQQKEEVTLIQIMDAIRSLEGQLAELREIAAHSVV